MIRDRTRAADAVAHMWMLASRLATSTLYMQQLWHVSPTSICVCLASHAQSKSTTAEAPCVTGPTFTCPSLDNPAGCGAYLGCPGNKLTKSCMSSTPDCDTGAAACLMYCTACTS